MEYDPSLRRSSVPSCPGNGGIGTFGSILVILFALGIVAGIIAIAVLRSQAASAPPKKEEEFASYTAQGMQEITPLPQRCNCDQGNPW